MLQSSKLFHLVSNVSLLQMKKWKFWAEAEVNITFYYIQSLCPPLRTPSTPLHSLPPAEF